MPVQKPARPLPVHADTPHRFFHSSAPAVSFSGRSPEIEQGIWKRQQEGNGKTAKFARLDGDEPDLAILGAIRRYKEAFVILLNPDKPSDIIGYIRYLPDFIPLPPLKESE